MVLAYQRQDIISWTSKPQHAMHLIGTSAVLDLKPVCCCCFKALFHAKSRDYQQELLSTHRQTKTVRRQF